MTHPEPNAWVIVPTYNERNNLRPLVTAVLESSSEVGVLVVDDNSPDGTGDIADEMAAESHRVDVIHRPGKLGLGTAYLAGFARALASRPNFVLSMDGDFSHHPRYVPDLLERAKEGYDLVIGSRYVPGGGTPDFPPSRKLLSGGANLLAHWAVGLEARDTTAGFRCYRRQVLESLPLSQIRSNGYSFLIEMLYLVQHAGCRVAEVPIVFEDRKHDVSKISRGEIFKALRTVARLTLRRTTSILPAASRRAETGDSARAPFSDPTHEDPQYEEVPCNLCGAGASGATDDTRLRFPSTLDAAEAGSWSAFCCTSAGYGVHPPIVECRTCGLVFASPRLRSEEIESRYAEVEDPLYQQEREGRELTFRRHLRDFENHTGLGPGHRLLDVGAYLGVFVEVAAVRGWDAWGLELSRWAVDVAQSRGLNMVRARLDDKPFDEDHFDALTMWDVIEHVTDPKGTLEAARHCLRPGGWIAVHTMDLDSLFARLAGRRWPWLMEMHLYYFGRRTLKATLEAAGFVDVSFRAQGRHLRLAYLATRLRRLSPRLASLVGGTLRLLRLDRLAVPINFGDLVTAYARKPSGS